MRHLFTRRVCPELEMLVAVSERLRDGNGFLRDIDSIDALRTHVGTGLPSMASTRFA